MTVTCAHLVGSIPFDNAETVFSEVCSVLGDNLKRLPDGETGERLRWIFWQRGKIADHPTMEIDNDVGQAQIHQWDGTLIREWDLYRFKPGTDLSTVEFDPGYARDAIESYAVFKAKQADGTIPSGVKFQVCLPTPMAIGYWFVSPAARGDFFPVYERAISREVAEISAAIPKDDLAIQWDVCQEVLVWEDYFPSRPATYKEDILNMLARLGDAVPEPVELGYHLCFGTPNDEHLVMPKDMGTAVDMANGVFSKVSRSVQFLHVPVPRERDDEAFFAPLTGLQSPAGCELYIGLIHAGDRDGDARRIAAASTYVDNFGIATECGWGRGDPERVPGLLESHRIAASS